jgi:hypothetical protein
VPIPTPTGGPPTNDTEETLLNPYLVWNTLRLSIPTSNTLHLVHNHTHFTHRVYTPNVAYDLDFIILASLRIINGHTINEISLDNISYVNITLYSLLWYTIWDLTMAQCKGRNISS